MGIEATQVSRAFGIDVKFLDLRGGGVVFLPQQVALIGQGSEASVYATTPRLVTSAAEAGSLYGFGSPIHLAALMCYPKNGDGLGSVPLTIYPLDADGSGVVSAGDITPTGTQVGTASYRVVINGIKSKQFVIEDGEEGTDLEDRIAAAVQAELSMPMIATAGTDVVDLVSKWKGASANDLILSVEGPDQGVTFAFTQPINGAANPDVTAATDLIVQKWETQVINCLEVADTTALDAYSAFGEGRWGALVKRPLVVHTGYNGSVLATITAIGDARKTDRTNALAWAVGSPRLPLQIAARQATIVARQATDNPPVNYDLQPLKGIEPGPDSVQLNNTGRNAAVNAGVSTTEIVDGLVVCSDIITFHHPDGEDPPGYRYVVQIVKLQNIIYNLDLIFVGNGWPGAPLIPDIDITTNPAARQPKDAVAAINAKLAGLSAKAFISNLAAAQEKTTADISELNNMRLDGRIEIQVSGNASIISLDLGFGFFFGEALAA